MAIEKRIYVERFETASFRQFFDEHFSQIKNYIYYKTANVTLSEDLAQECFLKIWERRKKIDPATAKNYLYTVAKNLAVDHHKKKSSFFNFVSRKKFYF